MIGSLKVKSVIHDRFELTHVEMNTIKDLKSRTSIWYSIFSDIEVKVQTHFCWKSHFIQTRNQVEFFTAIVDLEWVKVCFLKIFELFVSYIISSFHFWSIRFTEMAFWNIFATSIFWIFYTIWTAVIFMNPMNWSSIICVSTSFDW